MMKIEMTRTLTIPRELEDAISFISELFSDDDDFTAVCCVIAAQDYEVEVREGWIKINVED